MFNDYNTSSIKLDSKKLKRVDSRYDSYEIFQVKL
jgi:hypothetical protein